MTKVRLNERIVAAAQFEPRAHRVDENIAQALELTLDAASKGARIIVLPELCISGYDLSGPREAMECAQTVDGYQTNAFVPIAERFNCHVVFGCVELHEGNLYNSAVIVGPRGPAGSVRKHNLWGLDFLWARRGDGEFPCVVTPEGRLGALIQSDVALEDAVASHVTPKTSWCTSYYGRGSVDTIALLVNWSAETAHPHPSWVNLAEVTQTNVIVANRLGEEGGIRFRGGSCIISRDLHVWTNGTNFNDTAIVGGMALV